MKVQISESDYLSQCGVALRRFVKAVYQYQGKRAQPDGRKTGMDFTNVVESYFSELAVAQALGIGWPGLNEFETDLQVPEIGCKIEVRHSRRTDAHLILYPKDRQDAVFVLVTGSLPNYTVRGWLPAKSCMKADFVRFGEFSEKPEWWIPQTSLEPIETLKGRIINKLYHKHANSFISTADALRVGSATV